MDGNLSSRIDEHDKMLVKMETILESMVISQNKMADNMSSMSSAIGKIDLWLEKITNLDSNTKESFKRVYRTIEPNEEDSKETIKEINSALKELEVARFFSKYPKLLFMVVLGFCVLNIEPIRKIIFGG